MADGLHAHGFRVHGSSIARSLVVAILTALESKGGGQIGCVTDYSGILGNPESSDVHAISVAFREVGILTLGVVVMGVNDSF